ncbi:MAG: 4-hydroxybenzoyl-CoA thioesterase [Methylibium sp. NZG]|nr:MAG: 4-hydroxybenzoyl-CoA thioesterase [Methylibium sp. NZG]
MGQDKTRGQTPAAAAQPTRSGFRFLDRLRVRWAEIDAQRIVFNGHYLMYFDTAVAGYWRALAAPYAQTMEQLGGDIYVRKATLEYVASAVYDDVLHVGVRCARVGTSSVLFSAAVFRQEQLLVSGELVYVFADPHTQTSRPVPQALREVFVGYEAGEAMVELRVGAWAELGRDATAIRSDVFVQEQKIPAALEWDPEDATCVHAVAYNRFGLPLATGRWVQHAPGVAKVGRMAVIAAMRSAGLGASILEALMQSARAAGNTEVVLHAQMSASAFYRRAGFEVRGGVFEEAGIAHIEMFKPLAA